MQIYHQCKNLLGTNIKLLKSFSHLTYSVIQQEKTRKKDLKFCHFYVSFTMKLLISHTINGK